MTPKEMNINVGERIGVARRRLKISQTALGERIGYSMNGIAKIERGESDPKLSVLLRIAQALGVDYELIVTGREKARIIADLTEAELEELMQRMEARRDQYHQDQGNPDYVGHKLSPETMARLPIE